MKFSQKSLSRLAMCHTDLQKLAIEAIKDAPYDFMITHGYRTPDEQFELYKKGRTLKDDRWIRTGNVVTFLDGYTKKSKHNLFPAEAFDVAILQKGKITWSVPLYIELAGHILEVADQLFDEEIINNRINWGGNWVRLHDYPHYQI